jgi:uncharacterized protein
MLRRLQRLLESARRLLVRAVDAWVVRPWVAIDTDRHRIPVGRSPEVRAVVTTIVAGVVLTLLHYLVLTGLAQDAVASQLPELLSVLGLQGAASVADGYRPLVQNLTWAVVCSFLYVVIPALVVTLGFREDLRDWGWSTQGLGRHLWVYAALFVPVLAAIVVVSGSAPFQASYPFYQPWHSWTDLLLWEVAYGAQFVALEFFFRGFLLRGLEPKLGSGAVLVMVLPYCMVHFQKPMFETFGAIVAGFVLGVLALRTRSIWGGVLLHVAVAWTMDLAAILRAGTAS